MYGFGRGIFLNIIKKIKFKLFRKKQIWFCGKRHIQILMVAKPDHFCKL